ncbi:hypothetical protein D9C73_013333 [Collichthys lucidus]|uniref:Uncharacterized protein n=1 Tax=Collichthys lucidus TaxID=240159 RepID=A0A4U5UYI8_COLLU|nr:hypothetical protein D9C73_013333 [Collichthys lucidus]
MSLFTSCNGSKLCCGDDAKQSTVIDFLPVIEGDPNDHNTIFTTLKECMRLSEDKVTIVTLNRPIWLKAVDTTCSGTAHIAHR